MKILLVAMAESIHTARWVKQITDQGWDVRLFPSNDHGIVHPALSCIPVYHTLGAQLGPLEWKLRWQRHRLFRAARWFLGSRLLPKFWPQRRVRQLQRVIAEFKPDILHSMEFQSAGYLTLAAKERDARDFPPWIATVWGSDIYYFARFPAHEAKIRQILHECDYFSCECRRDVCLAQVYGLRGFAFPPLPVTGGFDLAQVKELRQPGPVSGRRVIMLKGYQHWAGRALVGLAALEECVDLLSGYEIVLYAVSPVTARAARKFRQKYGVSLTFLPSGAPHEEVLKLHGRARVSIGLSLSDGISVSFLEALVMGSYPIQSWTACADEWIVDGQTGALVPPEDPEAVGRAIRRALTDDELVEQAAVGNWRSAQERLDHHLLKEKAVELYTTVAESLLKGNSPPLTEESSVSDFSC